MEKFFTTYTQSETEELGTQFSFALRPGDVIAMYGDLGAGKTAFVRGAVRGFGIDDYVASPTFAIVNEYIIGFNRHITKKNPDGTKKAVVKLKPHLLLDSLNSLTSPLAKELLVSYAFERVGYSTVHQPNVSSSRFDFIIEKNSQKYVIEIKDFQGSRYLHPEQLKGFLTNSEQLLPGVKRVLFIDTSRVTKEVRKLESEIDDVRIIDLSQVKKLLQEQPVDILAEY